MDNNKSNVFYFLVREWNFQFYEGLSKEIKLKNGGTKIVYITLSLYVKLQYLKGNFKGDEFYYLPDLLKEIEISEETINRIDDAIIAKFNFGLNRLYDTERFRPTQNSELLLKKHVCALNKIIHVKGVFISLSMDHFAFTLAGVLNELKGGLSLFFQPVGFPNDCFILMKNLWQRFTIFDENDNSMLEEYEKTLTLHPKDSVWYMKANPTAKVSLLNRILNKIRYFKQKAELLSVKKLTNEYSYFDDYYYYKDFFKPVKTYSGDKNKAELAISDINNRYIASNRKVFYYPLQYEPEMTILGYSPYFQNQLDIIKLISKHLKINDVLIIKENPKMFNRSDDFYSEIDKLPNVEWVGVSENSRELIKLSDKIITITGTVIAEALCLGKNVMFFGYPPFYEFSLREPITENSLKSIFNELYLFDNEENIRARFIEEWNNYKKSVIKFSLKPVTNPASLLQHTYLENPAEKAIEFYERVLSKCVAF
jgi:hypothetical protein